MHVQTSVHTDPIGRTWLDKTEEEFTFKDIYELCGFLQHEIQMSRRRYSEIAGKAGVCAQTVSKMASGESKAQRDSTVFEILRGLGFEVVVRQ